MKVYETENLRNVAVVGHGDSGKTSLVSALLYRAGAVAHLGKINQKNTITDYSEEEKERGITLSSAVAYGEWQGTKINFLDTPGYSNFIPDARAAMRVADGCLMVISGVDGVQVQTECLWDWAVQFELPVLFVVNLLDRERANFSLALKSLQKAFGKNVVPLVQPLGEGAAFRGYLDLLAGKAWEYPKGETGKAKTVAIPQDGKAVFEEKRRELVEKIAELDDALMEKYLDTGGLSEEEILTGLKKEFAARQIFPVLCSSAVRNIGSAKILDCLVHFSPSPLGRGKVKAKRDGKDTDVSPSDPFSAFVFKTIADPYAGKISLFRVYSGKAQADTQALNTGKDEREKLGAFFLMQGKEHFAIPEVQTGDIAAIAKLKTVGTGDTLADPAFPVAYDSVAFPEPILAFAVEPKSRTDEGKLSTTLKRLAEADPTLRVQRDPQTNDLLLAGTGQQHIEVAISMMKRLANLEIILHPPKVPYQETIKRKSEAKYRHKKQTGGRGQFAQCEIRLEPLPRGTGFEFVDKIFGGSIPQNFRPAVQKGVEEVAQKGFLAGYPVKDFRVVLFDGQFHDVDSSEIAFKIAGARAWKAAMEKASAVLLEPIMNVEITVSEDSVGDIMGDLNGRRGRVQGMDTRGSSQSIHVQVPMNEMLNYAGILKSITGDRGLFSMEFSHYEEVPASVAEKIIQQAKKGEKKEEEE
jgi:elongation factor G